MIINFRGTLKELLRPQFRGLGSIAYELTRRASVKDIIEALGVPHTEVGRLIVAGREISFAAPGAGDETLEVYPLSPPVDVTTPTVLRPIPLPGITFAVDMNVGKLATLLRMAGFDTLYRNEIADPDLVAVAVREKRILLSKDTDLLKRKEVVFGYLVRKIQPEKQLTEIVHLFGIREQFKPLSRCLRCNALLQPVEKRQILNRLEPLTQTYYHAFHRCPCCDRIYWPGTHRAKMLLLLTRCGA
ncbi:MAG: Mut7-C RNAse domain-containing protein [Desulfurivibrionaceae bacterium]|nr:Mut7-C RNAse domain-containing protein [Desulfurivibrionaceae bacterium]